MKKLLAMILVVCLALTLAPMAFAAGEEITLWTYPIGKWGDEAAVKALTDAFTADTGIKVKVEYLAYADGDDKVNTAIAAKNTPDLIMEGPERLVANWGANGYLVDLADMLDDQDRAEILSGALIPCINASGVMYEYPLCMTAHCMAINKTAFEEAGALQYVDLENHTWSTENFKKAVAALYSYFGETVGAVYCAGQGGDQGTRALINNLYGGKFTNDEHTQVTWDDPNNIKAMAELLALEGIEYDASLTGGDEIAKFYQGALKMAFCWNSVQQLNPNSAGTGEGLTVTGDEIAYMHFPTESGEPAELCGGIWGFGIFNNGDSAKIEAARTFIKWMCDSEHTRDAVLTSSFFAARTAAEGTDLSALFDSALMNEYSAKMLPYLGDYYNVIKGWAAIRTEWWNMLQEIGHGADIAETVAAHQATANAAATA